MQKTTPVKWNDNTANVFCNSLRADSRGKDGEMTWHARSSNIRKANK